MDDPSVQLQETLNDSIRRALASQRPVLTHLNADSSWLIQIPYPQDAVRPSGRSRWNLVVDPWLQGPQSDVASFFSTQWHTVEPCVKSMAELSQRLYAIETKARFVDETLMTEGQIETSASSKTPYIDAVVVSHEFTDHCNKRTLLELGSDTPVFATSRAAKLIRSWGYFDTVQEVPSFPATNADWRNSSLDALPSWLRISQMVSRSDALDYHSAILITFDVSMAGKLGSREAAPPAEGIIYTPHGMRARDMACLPDATPPIRILVLLHGLHDIKISTHELNLGAHNGLQAQRICQAKYWVSTHDEIKRATGLITPWLYRNVLTVQEALEEERKANVTVGVESEIIDMDMGGVTFADLAVGQSLLLV